MLKNLINTIKDMTPKTYSEKEIAAMAAERYPLCQKLVSKLAGIDLSIPMETSSVHMEEGQPKETVLAVFSCEYSHGWTDIVRTLNRGSEKIHFYTSKFSKYQMNKLDLRMAIDVTLCHELWHGVDALMGAPYCTKLFNIDLMDSTEVFTNVRAAEGLKALYPGQIDWKKLIYFSGVHPKEFEKSKEFSNNFGKKWYTNFKLRDGFGSATFFAKCSTH